MNKTRKIIYISLAGAITIASILLGVFVFRSSYIRIYETLTDLFVSIKYYFCKILKISISTMPTVSEQSDVIVWNPDIPFEWDDFKVKAVEFFELFFSGDNIKAFGKKVLNGIGIFSQIAMFIIPIFIILALLVKKIYESPNTKHNKDTKPLKIFKGISRMTYQPMKRELSGFLTFLKGVKPLLYVWIFIWVCNLNLLSIVIAFFAFYFYFAVSYDFVSIYTQVGKLLNDLSVIFETIPVWFLVPLFWYLFDRFRKRIANDKLRHKEAINCGFINILPIVSMTCGSMGKKKTTTMTDMALSQEVMFRQKAFELLEKNDMRFPNFPWIAFEMELKKCMEHGTVFNLSTCKQFVDKKKQRYEKHLNADLQLYGYDTNKYGLYYDDVLKNYYLFDVLETYAKLYFIYVIESSILVANYSIREDNVLNDLGNFPMWQTDFFPEKFSDISHHSHILDFDTLRLGKKLVENNPKNGSFEFGVVVISEVGKERGNNLENKEIKKGTDETNQKNDLFNSWLKMCRHAATVDNFPFIKVFTDEQRPESWGADARDLADIIFITDSTKQKLALPFYTIEEMVYDFVFKRFMNFYYDFRFRRGDNTLLIYLLKMLVSKISQYNERIFNRYGYSSVCVEVEQGRMNGKKVKHKYHLMNAKIYRHRFSTDCFSDYFKELAKNTKMGLRDYVEYQNDRATVQELKQQNSYFINSIYKDKEVQDVPSRI